jgi:hypothetical protein
MHVLVILWGFTWAAQYELEFCFVFNSIYSILLFLIPRSVF